MLSFASDYVEGAHPAILQRLIETNLIKQPGYGTDEYTASAKEKIKAACGCPDADVWLLTGGTILISGKESCIMRTSSAAKLIREEFLTICTIVGIILKRLWKRLKT